MHMPETWKVRLREVNGHGIRWMNCGHKGHQRSYFYNYLTLSPFFAPWHPTHLSSLVQCLLLYEASPAPSTCNCLFWSFSPIIFSLYMHYHLLLKFVLCMPLSQWTVIFMKSETILVICVFAIAHNTVPGTRWVFSNCLFRQITLNWTKWDEIKLVGGEKDQVEDDRREKGENRMGCTRENSMSQGEWEWEWVTEAR